jgi:hypothetical protein
VSTPGTANAQEETDTTEVRGPISRIIGFLVEVLDDLVGEDTITQDQADAIIAASEARAAEIRDGHLAERELLREMLEDDVITEDEASALPDDHWIFGGRFDEAWEDAELSSEELGDRFRGRRDVFRRGLRFGTFLDDGGIDHEEYDSLDDDHPLKQVDVTEYLADGLITTDELREIHDDLRSLKDGADDA